MISLRFYGTIANDPDHPEWNEDYFECDDESSIRKCALSDGASVSFSPRTWARLLVESYLANGAVNSGWLVDAQARLDAQYDRATFDLLDEIGAFEQGSYASLIGLSVDGDNRTLSITGIGDSILAIVNHASLVCIASFPYTQSSQFHASPLLLPSLAKHNSTVFSNETAPSFTLAKNLDDLRDCVILLMTDAIGAWFMRSIEDADERWKELLDIESKEEFKTLVVGERETHRLRVDDTTLVVLDHAIS